MKKCPPGVICVENISMFFIIACFVIVFYLFYSNMKNQNIVFNNKRHTKRECRRWMVRWPKLAIYESTK